MRRTMIAFVTSLFALTTAGIASSGTAERAPSSERGRAAAPSSKAGAATHAAEAVPLLIVRGTPDGAVTAEPVARYRGRVAKGVTLTVDGQPVEIERLGFWSVEVPLVEGENTFTFTATPADGVTESVERTVTFDPSLAKLRPLAPSDKAPVRSPAGDTAVTRERV